MLYVSSFPFGVGPSESARRAVMQTSATTQLCASLLRRSVRRNCVSLPRTPARAFRATSCSHGDIQSTVNPDEIAHFSRLSSLWWDEQGEFHFLHRMNPVRMQFIRDKVLEIRREDGDETFDESAALTGLDVLDVGCGGGLLSESLSRLGANTLGIDASPSNIAIAAHEGPLRYAHTSVEELLAQRGPRQFDAVCSMEVLEHVDNPHAFLSSCAALVKVGMSSRPSRRHLFLSTISRTPLAYALTILGAEHVLRLVARGTHTYAKFVRPAELLAFFAAPPLSWVSRTPPPRTEAETRGMLWVPWDGAWALVPRGAPGAEVWGEACNYLFWVRRPRE
ncbi:S-adenosyl-L-methionine-dependent methyltransferase [Amylocystis lapponica]|nr:S-adenosyl-L-methionine-dependent methyltransferase [Amylocystis lapponica]